MSYNIIATPKFKRELKRLAKKIHSLKNEYATLLDELNINPATGTPLGYDCYKIRLAIASKGKGKSGGARVITYVLVTGKTIFLLDIFDKSEQENITDKELLLLIKGIK
ncbi:MAG: type II toxin-antitoxin system RelE/ParE family toxin [Sphingobacteriales bacterium]|nr:type II toxin-antitoxin system RelE/ParE family toxin [Sphingobacteriales bacterium]